MSFFVIFISLKIFFLKKQHTLGNSNITTHEEECNSSINTLPTFANRSHV